MINGNFNIDTLQIEKLTNTLMTEVLEKFWDLKDVVLVQIACRKVDKKVEIMRLWKYEKFPIGGRRVCRYL